MNVSRGAHSAISSWASTGRSPAVLLPNFASAAPYLRKLPAIQWYSPEPVRFSTASPKLRRCSFAPPSPDEPTSTIANRGSKAIATERRLAVARDAFDADALGVDGRIGLEIVEPAGRAPGPGAQRAPIVGLSRLALVGQADDPARQPGAVVGLNAGRARSSRSPSRPRSASSSRRRTAFAGDGCRRRSPAVLPEALLPKPALPPAPRHQSRIRRTSSAPAPFLGVLWRARLSSRS